MLTNLVVFSACQRILRLGRGLLGLLLDMSPIVPLSPSAIPMARLVLASIGIHPGGPT